MRQSDQIDLLTAALVQAQLVLKPAVFDAVNPAFKSKYATLPSVVEASKVYATAGVAVVQDVQTADGGITVTTRLIHVSGQWIEFGPLLVPVEKATAHGVVSATTYGRRVHLAASCLIAADDDDDGNAAVAHAPKAAPVRKPEGYDDFVLDFRVTSDAGLDALRIAFAGAREARPDWIAYLTTVDTREYEAIKQRAQHAQGVPR